MATHSSVLAWRIPGTAEPGGLPSVGSHRVGHDWSDLATVTVIILYLSSFEWSDMLFSFKFSVNSMVRFSVQITNPRFSSVAQSCLTLCNPMNHSTPGLPVHHQFPGSTQTHVYQVDDAIQPSIFQVRMAYFQHLWITSLFPHQILEKLDQGPELNQS